MAMDQQATFSARTVRWLIALAAVGCAGGCQVDMNGQTLPSPYYQHDDLQYFSSGPEFKLSREAAAMKAFRETEALQTAPRPGN